MRQDVLESRSKDVVSRPLARLVQSISCAWLLIYGSWFSLALLALSIQFVDISPGTSTGLAAVIAMVFSAGAFVLHGGQRMTALGAFMFAAFIFTGVAGVLLVELGGSTRTTWLFLGLTIIVNSAVVLMAWRRLPVEVVSKPSAPQFLPVFLALLAAVLGFARVFPEALGTRAASAGIVLIVAIGALSQKRTHKIIMYLIALLLTLVYINQFFNGFGRLTIAGLGFAGVYVVNTQNPKYWHKLALLACIVPALIVGGIVRSETTSLEDVVALRSGGLGSVWAPLFYFEDVVMSDSLERQYGKTFVAASVAWVPRVFWETKPVGFGAELARTYEPAYARDGHSMAALHFGEWYVNFGWLGFPLLALFAVGIIRAVDRLERWASRAASGFANVVLGGVAFAVAGAFDYTWMGAFTFMSRGGFSIMVLCLIGLTLRITGVGRSDPQDGKPERRGPSVRMSRGIGSVGGDTEVSV